MNPVVGELTVCPENRCLAPAEVIEDYKIPDSEGQPVRHRVVLCVNKHRITVPD